MRVLAVVLLSLSQLSSGCARVAASSDADVGARGEARADARGELRVDASVGVVVRGFDQFQSNWARTVHLTAPSETRVGDVMWVVIMTATFNSGAVTAPSGFKLVSSDSHVCGHMGTGLHVFVGSVDGAVPSAIEFALPDDYWVSALVVVLGGLSTEAPVEVTSFARIGGNPFVVSALTGGAQPSYGVASYCASAGDTTTTFSTPTGATRIFVGNGLALFARDIAPGASFETDVAASPDTCGFAHGVILRRR